MSLKELYLNGDADRTAILLYRNRQKPPDLVGALLIRIQNSMSVVGRISILEIYDAVWESHAFNPK